MSAGVAGAQTGADLLRFSQYNYGLGTARSAAMGGAFTALGADLSSISINPAGLGMYRGSEVGLSLSLTTNKTKSDYFNNAGMMYRDDASRTRFSANNFGIAVNVYEGDGALTSATIGFSSNKLADFHTTAHASAYGNRSSILEYFSESLFKVPNSVVNIEGYGPYDDPSIAISQWGGVLAYKAGLINNVQGSTNTYTPFYGNPANGENALNPAATVNPSLINRSNGYLNEYSFAGGMNFGNKIYVGLTIGIQDFYYRNVSGYNETYSNNEPTENNYNTVGLNYTRRLRQDGSGVNFKVGIIYRPIPSLRLAAAVHTPTFLSVDEEYVEWMTGYYRNNPRGVYRDTPYAVQNYDINTPTRFLAGIAWTLPQGMGILTADYERVWYNGMRLRNTPYYGYSGEVNNDVKNTYQAANNVRVGAEVVVSNTIYLRAGYAYYGDCFKSSYRNGLMESSRLYNYNMDGIGQIRDYTNVSGGIGFHFKKNINLELAYVNTKYNYLRYDIFYSYPEATSADPNPATIESGFIKSTMNRHTFTASVALRF